MTAAVIVAAAIAAILAFDYLTVVAKSRRDAHADDRAVRDAQTIATLKAANAELEAEVARAFRFGFNACKTAMSLDTAEHPAVPRESRKHPRAELSLIKTEAPGDYTPEAS